MRILGLDPGSIATGYGLVERRGASVAHVTHGTLRPARGSALPARLAFLHREIARILDEHQPELAVIERIFAGRSVYSAIVLGAARGVALAAIAATGIPISEVSPQQVKLAVTGSGAADKTQVQAMVRRLLALPTAPPRDAADALAAALCCAQQGRLWTLQQGHHLTRVGSRPSGRARRQAL